MSQSFRAGVGLLLLSVLGACSKGGEGEDCYENGTCNEGLSCLSGKCVRAPEAAARKAVATPAAGTAEKQATPEPGAAPTPSSCTVEYTVHQTDGAEFDYPYDPPSAASWKATRTITASLEDWARRVDGANAVEAWAPSPPPLSRKALESGGWSPWTEPGYPTPNPAPLRSSEGPAPCQDYFCMARYEGERLSGFFVMAESTRYGSRGVWYRYRGECVPGSATAEAPGGATKQEPVFVTGALERLPKDAREAAKSFARALMNDDGATVIGWLSPTVDGCAPEPVDPGVLRVDIRTSSPREAFSSEAKCTGGTCTWPKWTSSYDPGRAVFVIEPENTSGSNGYMFEKTHGAWKLSRYCANTSMADPELEMD